MTKWNILTDDVVLNYDCVLYSEQYGIITTWNDCVREFGGRIKTAKSAIEEHYSHYIQLVLP